MTDSKIRWSICAAISALTHGGALLALALTTAPDPIENQPPPQSRINITSKTVNSVNATEARAQSEAAPESVTQSTSVGQGTYRQFSAIPTALKPQKATTTTLPTQIYSAIVTPKIRLKPIFETATSKPTALKPQKATTTTLPTQIYSAIVTPKIRLKPIFETATSKPTTVIATESSQTISAVKPISQVTKTKPAAFIATSTASLSLSTVFAPATATENFAKGSSTLTLPAEKGIASLAWSGKGSMNPVSLAAIQSFMQPGDTAQNTSTLHDGISAVLNSIPCARLQTVFQPETGELQIRGHIPDPKMRGPILAALTEQVGSAIPISDDLLILPRPQCGALSGIANLGLPQSTDQITNPRVVGPSGFARNYTYSKGQRLELELSTPKYDGFIYVDYFTADGNVLHLQPNATVPLELARAKSTQSVGKIRNDGPFLELTVSPPYGQEIAAAFASSVPLYEGLRAIKEPAEPYLKFLKSRVAKARATHPDFKGEWVYFFISTKEE